MTTDAQLQHDVIAELEWEPSVDHAHIGVAVRNGIVTLSGFVSSYGDKLAAERAALRVRGVHGLAEEIHVRFPTDPKTSDGEIARRIVDIIAWDTSIPTDAVDVKVEQGWVTLSGKVDWHYQRETARQDAAKIPGVKGVSNAIDVRPRATATDVKERITAAYQRAAAGEASGVEVKVEGGTVKLAGKVKNWRERAVAERAAWSAPGVTRVEDNIIVV